MEKEFKRAIARIQEGQYAGTHVKVELEGQLDRPDDSACDSCDGDGYFWCDYCSGEGYSICENCSDGHIDCARCSGSGVHQESDCADCDGLGYQYCEDCDDGYIYCNYCNEGRQECGECEGSGRGGDVEWDLENCQHFMRQQVSPEAAEALTFDRFYRDGSVDSEYTFTLPLDKAEYAIEFIKAFKALADEIGNGLDTNGAGMHIAILNSEDGNYPGGNSLDEAKFANFQTAMQPLLPALYFLASADPKSRGLGYRGPQVSMGSKYSAIYGVHGSCLEFRVFETCYDKPEAFYDYMIVIANCLEFYKDEPTDTKLNIGVLGIKDGVGVQRFFYTEKHLDALNSGLKWLKPAYKTIAQLKQERGVVSSKKALKEQEKRLELKWREEYASFKQRLAYEQKQVYHMAVANWHEQTMLGVHMTTSPTEYAKQKAALWRERHAINLRSYLKECQHKYQTQDISTFIEV